MASHVVVIDSSLRRLTIKTTPGKYLNDVRAEACSKWGIASPDQWGLKYNNKQLDLSQPIRLSSLSSGAKLDLVQLSKSPSVVNVALQLPDSEGGLRLTEKFPSTTSLWQILRRFESGVADQASTQHRNLNLTQRAAPQIEQGTSGAGKLCYERPVVNVMGREHSALSDLEKTLAQLGFNGGSILLKLSFRGSDIPMEEAMVEISKHFLLSETERSAGGPSSKPNTRAINEIREDVETDDESKAGQPLPTHTDQTQPPPDPVTTSSTANNGPAFQSDPSTVSLISPGPTANTEPPAQSHSLSAVLASSSESQSQSQTQPTNLSPSKRPLHIFSPSSSTAPLASTLEDPDSSYEPTDYHAKLHQARLASQGMNRRLPSDKEIAEAEQARLARLQSIEDVQVRIRLPDGWIVETRCRREDTSTTLYDFVTPLMQYPDQPFRLWITGAKGERVILSPASSSRLVADLGFKGRVLVNMVWDQGASNEARTNACLKQECRGNASEISAEVSTVAALDNEEGRGGRSEAVGAPAQRKTGELAGAEKEGKLKKMLLGKFGKR